MLRMTALMTAFCLILAGCAVYRVDSKAASDGFYLPKGLADQVLYLESVDKPHDVIGIISLATERASPREEVLARMRAEAAILGADAITALLSDNEPIGVRYTAKAVVFR